MATATTPDRAKAQGGRTLVEMAWDPITRIVGSLGIYTRIDFERREVAECYSTSAIFRGYSIFMKGKDPRDAHFITSRICGICGDNHATCSCYAQNMAYAVRPPALAEWIINLGEAAEFMFDHNIFQENLVGVDFCETMIKETNPGVWERAEKTVYPGGVGTMATIQTFTDYLVRLMKYVEFMKRVVPMHDDLFDFFYEALPGYEKVGQRRVLLGCWGAFQDPEYCNFQYKDMTEWGRRMFVTPGVVVDGKLVTTDLVEINLGIRILLGSSYYHDWTDQKLYVARDPLGNPVDQRHPWNQHTIPRPQKRDFDGGTYTRVMSPRWFDGQEFLALDTGGGPLARLWSTALAGLVDIGYIKATGQSVQINLPKTALKPPVTFEWKIPKWSNAIERDRARTYFQAYAAACAVYFVERALSEIRAGHTQTWEPFTVPEEGIGCGFTEAVRGVLSHHLVIRDRKIANYHPYPPTPWNASPRDVHGTPGPYEDAIQNTPIFEENGRDTFKGIDIRDAERLARATPMVRQITTGTVCHLDAGMVTAALEPWDLASLDVLFVENVGNLVCPASYDLGEDLRAVLLSVTEGEDKPIKYPTIFNSADLAIVTKTDLAVAAGFDRAELLRNFDAVRPGLQVIELSARSGAGVDAWIARLEAAAPDARSVASR